MKFFFAAGRYSIARNDNLDVFQANYLIARQAGKTYKDRYKTSSKYGKIRIPPIYRYACPPKIKVQGKLYVSDGDESEYIDKPKYDGNEDKYIEMKTVKKKK